jgi:hypothetical protein
MRIFSVLKFMLVVQLALAPAFVMAQIQTKKITFPAGKSETNVSGTIKGEQTIDYTVSANQGQEMHVSLNSKNKSLYFNVLAPGSNDEAIFVGSSDGYKFDGTLSMSGTYKVRVYLMRNAARRNETANFGLYVGVTGGAPQQRAGDAKVPGTNFNAMGQIPAARGNGAKGSEQAEFGVIRYSDGTAEVHVNLVGGWTRILKYANGAWTCTSKDCTVKHRRLNSDEWEVIVNGNEKYYIDNAVVFGG